MAVFEVCSFCDKLYDITKNCPCVPADQKEIELNSGKLVGELCELIDKAIIVPGNTAAEKTKYLYSFIRYTIKEKLETLNQ